MSVLVLTDYVDSHSSYFHTRTAWNSAPESVSGVYEGTSRGYSESVGTETNGPRMDLLFIRSLSHQQENIPVQIWVGGWAVNIDTVTKSL